MQFRVRFLVTALLILSPKAIFAAAMGAQSICEKFESSEFNERFSRCSPKEKKIAFIASEQEKFKRAVEQCRELLSAGISRKRVKAPTDLITSCLAARETWAKDSKRSKILSLRMNEVCSSAIQGQQKLGQACDSGFECENGLVCLGNTGGPPGSCRKPLALNESCDDDRMNASQLHGLILRNRNICGPNAYCGNKDGALKCLAMKKEGESCSGAQDECILGLRCQNQKCIDETRVSLKERCEQDSDCEVGASCSVSKICDTDKKQELCKGK